MNVCLIRSTSLQAHCSLREGMTKRASEMLACRILVYPQTVVLNIFVFENYGRTRAPNGQLRYVIVYGVQISQELVHLYVKSTIWNASLASSTIYVCMVLTSCRDGKKTQIEEFAPETRCAFVPFFSIERADVLHFHHHKKYNRSFGSNITLLQQFVSPPTISRITTTMQVCFTKSVSS